MANDETLLSVIPALQKETVGRSGAANAGHRSCAPLGQVRWRDRTGVFHRDLGDDEYAEIVIADRTYRDLA
jgi:hypothetical protein